MVERQPLYKQVLLNKSNGQLYIVIDKKSNIKAGEYVKVEVMDNGISR